MNQFKCNTQCFSLRQMGSLTMSQIPLIDLNDENLKPGTDTWLSASKVIRSALEENGCVFVSNSKVPMELCNSVFALIKELFDLPPETKMQKTTDKPNQSYYGNPKASLYEGIGIDLDGPSNEEAIQKFATIMWPKGYDHFWYPLKLTTFCFYAKIPL